MSKTRNVVSFSACHVKIEEQHLFPGKPPEERSGLEHFLQDKLKQGSSADDYCERAFQRRLGIHK